MPLGYSSLSTFKNLQEYTVKSLRCPREACSRHFHITSEGNWTSEGSSTQSHLPVKAGTQASWLRMQLPNYPHPSQLDTLGLLPVWLHPFLQLSLVLRKKTKTIFFFMFDCSLNYAIHHILHPFLSVSSVAGMETNLTS